MTPVTGAPTPGPTTSAQFTLSGRVSCSARPVATSKIEILSGPNIGASTTADADGRYTLASLAAGDVTIRASAPGYAAQTTSLSLDSNKTADFTLVEGAGTPGDRVSLSGTVTGTPATGDVAAALASAQVTIVAGANRGRTARTDSRGRYELSDLAPEESTVEATAVGYTTALTRVSLRDAEVADFKLTATSAATTLAASGRVVDVLSQTGVAGVTFSGDGLSGAPSDASGAFRLSMVANGDRNVRSVALTGGGAIERTIQLQLVSQNLVLSLIPASFDMAAFDEMFRSPLLRRWKSAPPLIVEQRAVQFASVEMSEGVAVADVMTAVESDGLVNDLSWALPQLTGNTFRAFVGVSRQTAAEGSRVSLLNAGSITVVRAVGLSAATGAYAWSRWLYAPDGTVIGGLMLLDRDFDRGGDPHRRALRAHELGHALGYAHMTRRPSVMNPAAQTEPTAFDLDATRIAFQRQPGSRSPDIDPDVTRSTQSATHGTWSAPTP